MTFQMYQGCLLYCQDSSDKKILKFPLPADIQYENIEPNFILSFITMFFIVFENLFFLLSIIFKGLVIQGGGGGGHEERIFWFHLV